MGTDKLLSFVLPTYGLKWLQKRERKEKKRQNVSREEGEVMQADKK